MIAASGAQPSEPVEVTPRGAAAVYVKKDEGGEHDIAYLSGELDLATAEGVAADLARAITAAGPDLTIDLSGVVFCDARGLSALVKTANRAEHAGGRISVQGVPPALARLLRITGLERRLPGRPRRTVEVRIAADASPPHPRDDGSRRHGTTLSEPGPETGIQHRSTYEGAR